MRIILYCFGVLSVLSCVICANTKSCNSLKDVAILAKDKYDSSFHHTLNGCVERLAFANKSVTEVYISDQNIGILGRDSVRHMVQLHTVSFLGCKMKTLEPGAFRNVPKLTSIQMSHGDLKEIPRGVFQLVPTLEVLRIENNDIDIVEDQAFANLSNLKKLYANNNKLEYWNREWFTNTSQVELINFKYNEIRTIPGRAFFELKKVREIYFDHNDISSIHEEAFKGIAKLLYLNLSYNKLSIMETNIFPNKIFIRSFFIDANKLNYLSNELLDKITVKELTMDNNPWTCPCRDRIKNWLYRTNGTLKVAEACVGSDIPVCGFSSSHSQTCLERIDEEVTKNILSTIKGLNRPINDSCTRLD